MTPVTRKHFEEQLDACRRELAACESGAWPRDTSDAMRYQHLPRMPYDPPEVVRKAHQRYVADLNRKEIAWLEGRLG